MQRSMTPIGEVTPLIEKEGVSATTRTAFALGHVYNDLAAAMWFSYTLLFLQRVALLEPVTAGSLMLLGKKSTLLTLMCKIFTFFVIRVFFNILTIAVKSLSFEGISYTDLCKITLIIRNFDNLN